MGGFVLWCDIEGCICRVRALTGKNGTLFGHISNVICWISFLLIF